MGKAKDQAGNIWETDAQGNPVRLIQPAGGPTPIGGPDPRLPYQVQQDRNKAVASQYEPQAAAADVQIKSAQAANALAIANAQRDKAVADAKAAEAQASNPGGPKIDSATRAAALQGFNYANQLQNTVDELRTLYTAGPGATHGIAGLKDYLPLTQNQAFDTKANAARGIVGQTMGFTGGQLNTEKESEKAVGPYLPQAGDRDEIIQQKIQALQDLADQGKAKAVQVLGGAPDANGNVHPVSPQQPVIDSNAPAPDIGLNGGAHTRSQIDPILKATAGKVGHMIAAGASDAQIKHFLVASGINPEDTSINEALKFRTSPDFAKWQRANPGASYPVGENFYTRQVPVSPARRLFNETAATGIGGGLAAAGAASANAITGGRLDSAIGALGGDPEMAQTGMDLLRTNHQLASFGGDMAGQASLEALAGLVPGAQGLMASRWGRRGADALYGAYSGSGEDNGDPLTGGVEGAISGLGFGALGRGAQRAGGRALTGVRNANLGYLDSQNIPLTIGQIGRGSENELGRTIGGVEERLMGLPGFDAIIGGARKRGDKAFNEAAFKQMGGSGLTGAEGVDEGQKLVNNAYSFLDPLQLPVDAQYAGSQAAVRANLPANHGAGINDRLNMIDNATINGALPGREWQSAVRGVRADQSSLRGQPFADQAVNSLGDVENNLMDLAARQGPQGTAHNLANANNLYSHFQTITSALDNGPAQRADELFSASRLDDAARAGARKFGGRASSIAGNRPFYDLTTAGKAVMPSLTPDSGTAGRMALVPLLTGMGGAGIGAALGGDDRADGGEMGAGYGALAGLAAAGPYSKAGQKLIQRALLGKRSDKVMKLGEYLINNPKYAGMFGSTLGRDYFFQPELPQQ